MKGSQTQEMHLECPLPCFENTWMPRNRFQTTPCCYPMESVFAEQTTERDRVDDYLNRIRDFLQDLYR